MKESKIVHLGMINGWIAGAPDSYIGCLDDSDFFSRYPATLFIDGLDHRNRPATGIYSTYVAIKDPDPNYILREGTTFRGRISGCVDFDQIDPTPPYRFNERTTFYLAAFELTNDYDFVSAYGRELKPRTLPQRLVDILCRRKAPPSLDPR